MQRLGRLFLIVGVLLLGGTAGYRLLPGFEPFNTLIFVFICLAFGELFYQIDKRILKK
ncbi:hypothetical protein SAMN02745136_04918 [Anaerocolumna jejuensis DSM 15929]|uniref:Uncharacterized protein n=1 Tax=Anaerocolumna jejuensis DSM 15929 TaxID=1121322 RepID=A0A1M7AP73_9FIRM|nr:hypothetical protein SAMN02745136_04918 [Anaerocolumna jejuensis DSM 15929]